MRILNMFKKELNIKAHTNTCITKQGASYGQLEYLYVT